ncbi:hypothetical protein O181_050609 [Austropuccinia psidii MF-1]|uniref:Uncharacterized protein n=1 Tax=Austropuccinia psidii MF-1 TaxID=1389203 RepID=A0A9Q3HPV5_9BASI|nr:hypothetical protein [Austropuccinia psidii MF-1]
MMKAFPSGNRCRDPKQEDRRNYGQLAQFHIVFSFPPPLLGHYPIVNSLLDWSKVIIRPMKHGDGKRTFKLGPIVTHGIQMPNLPRKQTPRQPTPGLSGTQWLEDLFCHKKPKIALLISTFDSSELTLPPFVQPSQPNEPPIPGPSQPSEPHENSLTHEPEPEVALMQSMEEPFAHPATPTSIIIIDNTPIGSLLPQRSQPPPPPGTKLPSFPQ